MGNLQVRFLEGWAPAMAPGYSTLGIISGLPVIREELARQKSHLAWSSRLGFEQRRHVRGGERDAASVDAGGAEEGGSDCWRAKRVSGL